MAVKINSNINSKKYFRIRIVTGMDKDGKDIIKNFYGNSKTDAENKRDNWIKNNNLRLDIINSKNSLTMAMNKWLWNIVKVSGIKGSTFERYEGIYRNYVDESKLGYMILEDIERINIQKCYTELFESGKSYSQIKNAHKLINMFFRYAEIEGYVVKNPCLGINLDEYKEEDFETDFDDFEDEGKIETFSNKEIEMLLNGIKNRKLNILVKFAIGTGLRQGEILALNKSDIKDMTVQVTKTLKYVKNFDDRNKPFMELKITPPKSKRSRRKVPIPTELKKDLVELNKICIEERLKLGEAYIENEMLFPSETGNYIDSRNLIRSWQRSFKNSTVPYKKFHSLRHTYATQLLKNGSQLLTVSRLLGHSSVKTTEIYAHVLDTTKQNDVQNLNKLFK